MQMF